VNGAPSWPLVVVAAFVVLAVAILGNRWMPNRPLAAQLQPTIGAPSQPTSPATVLATYIGRETCGQCHASEVRAWETSHHAQAMQNATESTVHGDFNDAHFAYGDVTTTFYRKDGKFMVRTDGPEGALQDYEAKFNFGVSPLEQYLLELPGGRLQALTVAWDSRSKADGGQRWFHLHLNETIKAGDPLHWTGLQQNWNFECAECHSTNLRRNYDPVSGDYKTTYSEINVSCESCHGPGSLHASWARKEAGWHALDATKGLAVSLDERRDVSWTLDPATGNSGRSAPRRTTHEIETCAHCHSRRGPIWGDVPLGAPIGDGYRVALLDDNLYFPDGQIRDEVYEYGSFLQSRMFHAGVTCSDCHEPHSLELRAPGNGVCAQCHAREKYDVAAHRRHEPQSAGAQCVSCHMPTRTYMVVDPRRDHSIRIPRPDLSVSLGTPNACNGCHADKSPQWATDQVKSWHGDLDPGFQRFAETLQAGAVGAPGAREQLLALAKDVSSPGIARASAVSRLDRIVNSAQRESLRSLLHDADPLVRRAAAEAYGGAPAEVRQEVFPLLDDPIRDVRLQATQTLATLPAQNLSGEERGRRDKGIEEYIASQNSNADRPEAHHNIGLVLMELGRAREAEAEFKKALELDRDFVPAAVTLADLYRGLGRDAEAEHILRSLLARAPTAAAAHFSLGLWLVRTGRHEEALVEFKQAANLAPESAHFGYVYAVSVASAGNRAQAMEILRDLLRRHAYDRESLYGAASFARDLGHQEEAVGYATRLAQLEPDDADIQRFLSEIRQ
jgi:tetratricopeptide (TPR) repeat protein/ssDNA-binding Zn-finger/Zn-ribbon topoisomerase 1